MVHSTVLEITTHHSHQRYYSVSIIEFLYAFAHLINQMNGMDFDPYLISQKQSSGKKKNSVAQKKPNKQKKTYYRRLNTKRNI